MIRFLHISDLHIRGKPSRELLLRLAYIKLTYRDHKKIITGDITQDGYLSQYYEAMRLLMSDNSYICPGNHDYGYAGNFYEAKRAKWFDQYMFQTSKYMNAWARPIVNILEDGETKIALIGLNSNLKTRNPFDFACGKIGLWQRWWLKRILKQHSDKVRIVYFHHHPFDRGPWTGMKDAERFMTMLQGQCELVLFGHKHKPELFHKNYITMAAAGKLDECDTVTEIIVDRTNVTLNQVPVI